MTTRALVTVALFALLSGWVSGQSPPSKRTADEEATLLKKNRTLLEGLLDDGIKLADAETPLDRAAACRRAADRLAVEMAAAVRYDDTDRAIEIGDQLTDLLTDGFLPSFTAARSSIGPASPEFGRLQTVQQESALQLNTAIDSIPAKSPIASGPRVSAIRKKLVKLAAQVGPPVE